MFLPYWIVQKIKKKYQLIYFIFSKNTKSLISFQSWIKPLTCIKIIKVLRFKKKKTYFLKKKKKKNIKFFGSDEKHYTSSIVRQMTIIIVGLKILKPHFFDFCAKYFSYSKKRKID